MRIINSKRLIPLARQYLIGIELKFPLGWLIFNRWFWITILGCWAIAIGPVIVIYVLLFLPASLKAVGVFSIIIGWGIAGGYKDWIKARKREEQKPGDEYQTTVP